MSDVKHTPGPWVLGKPGRDVEDIHMCVVMTAYASGEHAKSYDVICECRQGSSVRIPLDQKIANARLIAAAPEMLDALKQALRHIERDEVARGRPFAAGNVVRATISKAKGINPDE